MKPRKKPAKPFATQSRILGIKGVRVWDWDTMPAKDLVAWWRKQKELQKQNSDPNFLKKSIETLEDAMKRRGINPEEHK